MLVGQKLDLRMVWNTVHSTDDRQLVQRELAVAERILPAGGQELVPVDMTFF